jgi:hypothetical protein
VWHRGTTLPHPRDSDISLTGLACRTATDCDAYGQIFTASGEQVPVLYTGTAGHWSGAIIPTLPRSARRDAASLITSMSCEANGHCVAAAVTYSENSNLAAPLVISGSGSTWSGFVPTMPANATAGNKREAIVTAAGCPAAGACSVAGEYEDQHLSGQAFTINESGSGWSRATEVTLPANAAADAGDQNTNVNALDCPSTGNCVAVGSYVNTSRNSEGLLIDESGGTWDTGTEAILPSSHNTNIRGQNVILAGLSCASLGNCVATGSYNAPGYLRTHQNLVLQETGGSWSPGTSLALPSDHAHVQGNLAEQVDCLPGSGTPDCTVAGNFVTMLGQWHAMAASERSGTFAPGTEMTVPAAGHAQVVDSLYQNENPIWEPTRSVLSANGEAFIYNAAARGWLTDTWYARVHGHREVIGKLHSYVSSVEAHHEQVRLTPVGRKAIKAVKKTVQVTMVVSFAPRTGAKASHTGHFSVQHLNQHHHG